MGGGIGLLAGASHRVATPGTRLAMPEISIGLYPDVGGSWFLRRAPGKIGLFLALTGAPFNGADARFVSALDLGCGTGLCGPLVRPLAERLTGVDLSARMIEKARSLAVYDRLEQGDVIEFLEGNGGERWDLVLAADVFIYVGDLEPVFARLERAMAEGVFCFSVESLASEGDEMRLLPSLRYAHSEPYLERLAARHGFAVAVMKHAPVREDQGEVIEGLYVILRRKPR
jgi:predicted TPR repeat methyltransferase